MIRRKVTEAGCELWNADVKLEKIDDYKLEGPPAAIDVNMMKEENESGRSDLAIFEKSITAGNRKCPMCQEEVTVKCYRHHLRMTDGLVNSKIGIRNDENKFGDKSIRSGNIVDGKDFALELVGGVTGEGPSGKGDKSGIVCLPGVECQICNQVYSNGANLRKHMYNVHKMVRVKCTMCEKTVNKKSLDRHMKNVHSANEIGSRKEKKSDSGSGRFPCSICGLKCQSSVGLLNHVRAVHEEGQYKCARCEFQGTRKILEKHVKKEHSKKIYQCGNCQKILKSKSTLKEHMWIHTEHRRFICYVCGMRFKRTSNYRGHMKSHQEKKFQCRICGNFFLRKRYLAIHEQTIHNYYGDGIPPRERGYQCEMCGARLRWKNNLLAHMRIHTGEKPYKCKICDDHFTCHGSLRTHMAKHSVCQMGQIESTVLMRQAYSGTEVEPNESSEAEAQES